MNQFQKRGDRSSRRALCVAGALLAITSVASAGVLNSTINGEVFDLDPSSGVGGVGCKFSSTTSPSGSCTLAESHDYGYDSDGKAIGSLGVGGTANASVDLRGLHASASANLALSGYAKLIQYELDAGSTAEAAYTDRITFGATTPELGYLYFSITAEGSVANDAGATTQLGLLSGLSSSWEACDVTDAGSCTVKIMVDFSAPVILEASLAVFDRTRVGGIADEPGYYGYTSFGAANFADTAFASGLVETDLDGNKLDLAYTSDAGFNYLTSSVPEPSIAILIGLGWMFVRTSKAKHSESI